MSDSFYLVPTDSGLSQGALKRENAKLKNEIESMRKRLESMERAIQVRKEQDLQLRDSIFQATREVRCLMKFLYLHTLTSLPN